MTNSDPVPASFNLAAHVLAAGAHVPDKTALVIAGDRVQQMTYAQVIASVRARAHLLLDHGLCPGDRVILRIGNTADFPVFYLAAIAVGVIPVPTSTALTAPEIVKISTTIAPQAILHGQGLALDAVPVQQMATDDLVPGSDAPMADFDIGDPDRPAYIIYTSGTSGRPVPVVHAHRAIWARRMMFDGWYGLQAQDRLLHAGAFNWTYTLGTGLMDPWTVGATAIVPQDGTPAQALPDLLHQQNATIFAAAPGVYRRMLRCEFPQLPKLRHGLSAGEKLAADFRAAWQAKTGTAIHEAFGMSECSTFISGSPSRPAPPGTLGYPQPGRRVTLLDEQGPVAPGTPGTIAIHRSDPGLMLGYFDAPEETARRFQGDWFLTGDIGTMGKTGAIAYAGRADDMMNAGGVRVSPVEVEDALTSYPTISEAAACAVQVQAGTHVIAAFYVATDMIDEDDLRRFLKARLAAYKLPRLLIAKETLPRGANNKLLRRALRHEWETEHGQT